jgi:hypothetical protein
MKHRDRGGDCPYAVIGVKPEANAATIKTEYYAKSKMFHPDASSSGSSTNADWLQLQDAYSVLGCPVRRSAHDQQAAGAPIIAPHQPYPPAYNVRHTPTDEARRLAGGYKWRVGVALALVAVCIPVYQLTNQIKAKAQAARRALQTAAVSAGVAGEAAVEGES